MNRIGPQVSRLEGTRGVLDCRVSRPVGRWVQGALGGR